MSSTQGSMDRVEAVVSALKATVERLEVSLQYMPATRAASIEPVIERIRGESLEAANELRRLQIDVLQTRLGLAAQQTDVQTRLAAIAAREKTAAEQYEAGMKWMLSGDIANGMLRQKEEAIASREETMAGREAQILDQMKELGRRQSEVERGEATLAEREQQIADKERELTSREDAVRRRETAADLREAELKRREDAVAARESNMVTREAQL